MAMYSGKHRNRKPNSKSARQGPKTLEEYSTELGYTDPDELHKDAEAFYNEHGPFTAEEFAEEKDLNSPKKVNGVLSVMGFHNYEISKSLEAEGDNDNLEPQFKIEGE